ncbi:hypothetical protein [Streptomyces sp. NPDC021608]|uniref:hypothetical protein n=1 Tax=Streptomyces sp. NPDC021608 TaxID=3154903 RepID=UPI0033C9FC31
MRSCEGLKATARPDGDQKRRERSACSRSGSFRVAPLWESLLGFYCYTAGELYSNNGRTSGWWLLTDDDTGHRNVWVNEVNLDDYGWEHDIELLPAC